MFKVLLLSVFIFTSSVWGINPEEVRVHHAKSWGVKIFYPSGFRIQSKSNRKITLLFPKRSVKMNFFQKSSDSEIRMGQFLSEFREETSGLLEESPKEFPQENLLIQKFYTMEGDEKDYQIFAAKYVGDQIVFAQVSLGKSPDEWSENWVRAILEKLQMGEDP